MNTFVTGYCISEAILYFEFSHMLVANASEMSSPVSSELRGKSSIVRWPRELFWLCCEHLMSCKIEEVVS